MHLVSSLHEASSEYTCLRSPEVLTTVRADSKYEHTDSFAVDVARRRRRRRRATFDKVGKVRKSSSSCLSNGSLTVNRSPYVYFLRDVHIFI